VIPAQLYLDEDVDPLLAQVLRNRGIDCLSTQEANNRGKSDKDQLAFAVNHGRAFLTFNVRDFVQISQNYAVEGKKHSGIILSQHHPFRELLRRTLLLLQKHGKEELTNRTVWLQDYQMPPKEL
jgi:predicted nuclease of predicted toxin-antitoxin system